jgi:cell fate regulator YaaT (PSP1 superfamily)
LAGPALVRIALSGSVRPACCRAGDEPLEIGDRCVVGGDGGRGQLGTVVRVPFEAAPPGPAATPPVLRLATAADDETEGWLEQRRREALQIASRRAAELNLAMRFLRAEPVPSGRRVTLYFVAEGRVDFRQLVRDLARELRARVELRQIGVRDAAVRQGGVGHCGRPLCCSTWLDGFAPVSMRMAKVQGLPVNPAKISGQCGRLMCCLRYEVGDAERGGREERGGERD